MTNSPNPGNTPDSPPDRPTRFRRLRRVGIPLGVGLLAVGAGAGWYGWIFVHEQLAPLVATSLSKTLKRPVHLGKVERFSLSGIRLGPSSLPATATDPSHLSLQSIEVSFNLWQTIMTRKLALDVTANKPEVYLEQDKNGDWVKTEIQEKKEEGPITTELKTIQFKDAVAVLSPAPKVGDRRTSITLSQLNGTAKFSDKSQRINYDLSGQSATGGRINLTGETIRTPLQTNLQLRAQNYSLLELERLIKLPFSLPTGRADANLAVQIRPNQEIPSLVGTAQFRDASLKLPQAPQIFSKASGNLQFQGNRIRLDKVRSRFGDIPLTAQGVIDLKHGFNLTAQMPPTALPTLLKTLQMHPSVAVVGEVAADLKVTGAIAKPVLLGTTRNTKPMRLDRIDLSRFSASFKLDTAAQVVTILDAQATPAAGGQISGTGQIRLVNDPQQLAFNVRAEHVAADAIARAYTGGSPLPITIGRVNAQAQLTGSAVNPKILALWQAPEATYAGSGEITVDNTAMTFRNTAFRVAGGTVNAEGQAANGRWQALVTGAQIPLKQFSPDLRGLFNGRFVASGTLANISPATIRAQGSARLSEGVAVINKPLTAQVLWNGQTLVVQNANAPGFEANGAIAVRVTGTPAITAFDLNVRIRNYDLNDLAIPLPVAVAYSGRVDLLGRVTGTPTAPAVNGDLTLRQFILNRVAFDPVLRGKLRVDRGVALNLAGVQDRIALVLNSAYQPVAFEIQRGQAFAKGQSQGELLLVETRNFPLEFLNPASTAVLFPVSGNINGNFAVNLKQMEVNGQVAISKPGLGNYRADQFGGRLSFSKGTATLKGAELRRGKSVFQINGSANVLSANPQFQGELNVAQGYLQDVLGLLQLFDITDLARGSKPPVYGDAADLQAAPVEMTKATLLDQLHRLSEVETLLAQAQARRKASFLPEFRDIKGTFSGEVKVAGSLQAGVNAKFNLRGQNWEWGPYSVKQVVADGSLENGTLTLLPLRFQSDQSVIAFSGEISKDKQSGQFRMENIPVELIKDAFNLPINLEGQLNANATIAGSLNDPQAIGFIQLRNGSLNGTSIQLAQGGFQYKNARLGFGSTINLIGKEPLKISGSIPQRLPFASVEPDNDQVTLDVDVRDEGLAVLNLLNDQVAWQDGKGEVKLQVRGTVQNPIATGTIQVSNATLQARALPEPLTGVTGTILFDRDRLKVNQIRGQFSRGQVSAAGVIPLARKFSATDPDQKTPLDVTLNQIKISLKGLYQGGVDGKVQVTGTALNPVIGGKIRLSNGQVLLSQTEQQVGGTSQPSAALEFSNLRLELGDNVRITSAPLLNFVASGGLTLNGSLDDLRPSGTIRLTAGQVNLFTTQFVLARGYPQTAIFQPNRGLDPILNVRLTAVVSEVTGSRLPSVTSPSEIVDAPTFNRYGSLQSVQVQARVSGPASQLSEKLELTSSPARSPAEIVSLLGGNFASTLGQGGGTLGLANLAGSALLTNVQGAIGNALGLSEFRLFPTITTNHNSRNARTSSTLDLAMEAAVDITRSLSFSVLKILTLDQPAQFGLRYRLNRQFIFRSSTDFSGDSRAVVEYEKRF